MLCLRKIIGYNVTLVLQNDGHSVWFFSTAQSAEWQEIAKKGQLMFALVEIYFDKCTLMLCYIEKK
jgi:hypothetical protein